MKDRLPIPNAEEVTGFNKVKYFERVYNDGYKGKDYGLDEINFAGFIHHTFETFVHHNKHLTIGEFKKLIK